MSCQRIEKLRQQYTGRHVSVDARRPELARFAGVPARVKTVNFSGRALVQFDGADRGWYDVELDHLKVIDSPAPKADVNNKPAKANAAGNPTPKKAEPAAEPVATVELSRLELARLQKQSGKPATP